MEAPGQLPSPKSGAEGSVHLELLYEQTLDKL